MAGARPHIEKRLAAILLIAALALGIWLRLTNPHVLARSPDEKTYISYVTSIAQSPVEAPRELVRSYNATPGDWIYPIPLRIGYLYTIWAVMKLWGLTPEQAGVAVSAGSSILQLLMVALVGVRFFGRWIAAAAVAFLGACTADLTMARRVWGDEPNAAAALVFLWLCAELAFRQRGRGWYAALWIWAGYFMLLKETAGFFFGFCVAGLMVHAWRQGRDWLKITWLAVGAVVTAIVSFGIMSCLCGGVPVALEVIRHNALAEPGNAYQNLYMSGPWYSIPLELWIVGPAAGTMAAVAFAALLLRRNSLRNVLALDQWQEALAWGIAGLILLVATAVSLRGTLMDLRYVSPILGAWHLMAGLGVSYLLVRIRRRFGGRTGVCVAAVAIIAMVSAVAVDYSIYRVSYVGRDLDDLDVLHVVTAPLGR
jgi:hypothetical protein